MALPLALTPAEEKVVNAAAAGAVADFTAGDKQADNPAQGAAWGDDRSVRAEVIYALAVGTNPAWPVHAKGVQIRGAKIVGALDFEAATLRCPLLLAGCYIAEPVTLRNATIPALYLHGSHLPDLNADGVNVRGDVFLREGFTATGEVRLIGAQIGGQLACDGGSFTNQNGRALNADRVSVRGSVFLREGFTATGEVRLIGAQIGGQLACDGGSFTNQNGRALNADGVNVRGAVFLRGGFTAAGEVRLLGAQIGGDLSCIGASFTNQNGPALNADGVNVRGAVFLREGFTATGEVRLLGAQIGGQLACDGGSFTNQNGPALNADGVNVRGNVFLRGGFTATGEVRLLGAQIDGSLECNGGRFSNQNGDALSADGVNVRGNVVLREGFTATGEVRLIGAQIGGQLACDGGSFTNQNGRALSADGVNVRGNLFLSEGFTATGEVRLLGAQIGGDLSCIRGSFSNQNRPALNADGVNVRGTVFLSEKFTATGAVRLPGAQIGGDLSCIRGSFSNQNGDALSMERTTVEGTFFMRKLKGPRKGTINLIGAKVGILCDDADSWPAKGGLGLDGFLYEAIAPGSPISAKERIEWLGRQESFRPQPYEQLIRVLRNMGHEREARKIAIAKQKALRKSGALGGLGKAWNYLVGGVVGHGYRPILALGWLASFVLLATMLFWSASRSGRMVPAPQHHLSASASPHQGRSSCSERPQPFLYAVETIVPGLDLHQKSCWWLAPKDGTDCLYLLFEFLVIVYYLASLAVAATLAAALAGLIKRD